MAKTSQTSESKSPQQNQQTKATTSEQVAGEAAVADTTLMGPAGQLAGGGVASGLGNRALSSVQRQVMAGRIGQMKGNGHLQQMVTVARQNQQYAPYQPNKLTAPSEGSSIQRVNREQSGNQSERDSDLSTQEESTEVELVGNESLGSDLPPNPDEGDQASNSLEVITAEESLDTQTDEQTDDLDITVGTTETDSSGLDSGNDSETLDSSQIDDFSISEQQPADLDNLNPNDSIDNKEDVETLQPLSSDIAQTAPEQPDLSMIQRADDGGGIWGGIRRGVSGVASSLKSGLSGIRQTMGGGLLKGFRQRITGVVNGLKSGWTGISQMAGGAFSGLRGQASNMMQGLGNLASTATAGIQNGWTSLSQTATGIANGLKRQLQGTMGTVTGAVQSLSQSLRQLNAGGVRASWNRISSIVGGISQGLQQAGKAVFQRMSGLWGGLRNRFTGVLQSLSNRARAIYGRLQSVAQGVRQRLTTAWSALRNRASQMSGLAGSFLSGLGSLVNRLMSWGKRLWGNIRQQWGALTSRLRGVVQSVRQRVANVTQGVRKRVRSMWGGIRAMWGRLKGWVKRQVGQLTRGVGSLWSRIRGFSIGTVVDKVAKYAPFVRAVEQAVQDPDAAMEPIVTAIAGKLQAGMPAQALQTGQQKLQEHSGGALSPASASSAATIQRQPLSTAKNTTIIQRESRSTASLLEVGKGFGRNVSHKWGQIDVGQMVKDVLWTLVWPWPAVGHELSGLWNTDWTNAANSLFATRNVFDAPLGFLHDLWTNILHLLDFPLALWRRINNILMHLMGWITLILIVGGAIGGGIIGSILPVVGTAAGAWVGAQAGWGASLALGEAFLISFVAAHGLTIQKTLVELLTGTQTSDEKEDDYSQLADSFIGLAVTAILMLLAWLASKLASAIVKFVQRLRAPKAEPSIIDTPGTESVRKGETGRREGDPVRENEPARDAERPNSDEKLRPGSGRIVSIKNIRYSQRTAGNKLYDGRTISEVASEMRKNGYTEEPPNVVDWGDGGYHTIDHRRVVAALEAELEHIPVAVHRSQQPLPPELSARYQFRKAFTDSETGIAYPKGHMPKTWGEAVMGRSAAQGAGFPIRGSTEPPAITGR